MDTSVYVTCWVWEGFWLFKQMVQLFGAGKRSGLGSGWHKESRLEFAFC